MPRELPGREPRVEIFAIDRQQDLDSRTPQDYDGNYGRDVRRIRGGAEDVSEDLLPASTMDRKLFNSFKGMNTE